MSKEAMKLALEALQKIYIAPEHEDYIKVWWPACEQAITALREALAEQPAQQEPVAWLDEYGNAFPLVAKQYSVVGKHWKPLYTSPPAQRTWVNATAWRGLTDEEIKALASWWPSYDQMPALMVLAKDIQNSLKEKNT